MLLPRLVLERPRTLEDACALLAERGDDAALYAGGTELLLALKLRVLRYGCLVDLKRIPRLARVVEEPDGTLVLGALATHRALEHDPLVRRRLPAYAALSADIGNVRIRVAGTLGGKAFAEPHADPPTLLAARRRSRLRSGGAPSPTSMGRSPRARSVRRRRSRWTRTCTARPTTSATSSPSCSAAPCAPRPPVREGTDGR